MRIHLQNIKCYEDRVFDFGLDGLALLSGQSGKGKSTIIQGIHFALFGVGNKITSFGKTSCKVELEFDGIKIMRSKNPGRLIVNDVIEGDAGQSLINDKFGETFDVTGYIPQNAMKSFIMMNPTDKLSFLERFAFEGTDLVGMKLRCKEYVSGKNTALLDAISKLEMAIEMADSFQEPEMVDFPIKVTNNNYDKAINNENIRHKNTNVLISKLEKSIIESRDKLSKAENALILVDVNNKELDIISVELTAENMKKLEICDNADDIDDYIILLNVIISNREFLKLSETYILYDAELTKVVQDELSELRRKLNDVSSELWLTYDRNETDEMITDNENLLKDLERLENLKSKLKNKNMTSSVMATVIEKNKKLRDKLQQSHNCPSCKTRLRLVDGCLSNDTDEFQLPSNFTKAQLTTLIEEMTSDVILSKDIEEIYSLYEENLPDITDVRHDLDYMRSYKFEQVEHEKTKLSYENCINNGVFSKTCMSFKDKVASCKVELDKLEKSRCVETDLETEMTEDELRSYIQSIKVKMVEKSHCCKRIDDLSLRSNRYKNSNDKILASYDVSLDTIVSILKTKIKEGELELTDLYTKRKLHSVNLEQIARWVRMTDDLKTYRGWEDKLSGLQDIETTRRNEYSAALTLKDKILEAESIAMVNLVESINTHARVYLDDFFEDDPIVVTLQAFTHTKKVTKAQISIDIEYKGMECDLQMLSGGEMSRIVLAYTLALAEMFNSPLLLLDECTCNLDQETTNHVFDAIKEHFNGKLTIIVAHQVVTGIFDRSIDLDN